MYINAPLPKLMPCWLAVIARPPQHVRHRMKMLLLKVELMLPEKLTELLASSMPSPAALISLRGHLSNAVHVDTVAVRCTDHPCKDDAPAPQPIPVWLINPAARWNEPTAR